MEMQPVNGEQQQQAAALEKCIMKFAEVTCSVSFVSNKHSFLNHVKKMNS